MPGAEDIERLREKAQAIGFALCGIARAEEFEELQHLPEWLARGYAGEMRYLHDERRAQIENVLPGARSVIVCAMNYNAPRPYSTEFFRGESAFSESSPIKDSVGPRGWISRYAWGEEYHRVIGDKLEELLAWMRTRSEFGPEFRARAYVDTGPVLERVAAKYAGLGWQGKNTCLINERAGSWLFLGVILTNLEFTPETAPNLPARDRCGTCRRCIEVCPTDAIVEAYVLDARRCIAYLTIELRGPIPLEFRDAMGAHVFGCDICQDVCPWNRKSLRSVSPEFLPRKIGEVRSDFQPSEMVSANAAEGYELFAPQLEWLLALSEEEFRFVFRESPVKRAKYRGLIRNACVAVGNSRLAPDDAAYARILQKLEELAASEDALIAEHAQWALEKLRARAQNQWEEVTTRMEAS